MSYDNEIHIQCRTCGNKYMLAGQFISVAVEYYVPSHTTIEGLNEFLALHTICTEDFASEQELECMPIDNNYANKPFASFILKYE